MKENKILRLSAYASLILALFGIAYGIIINSGMVIFDGIFSFISLGLSMLSIQVLKDLNAGKEDARFPFGKSHFEPFLIFFKSLVIIALCLFSISDAIAGLIDGGRYVDPGLAIVYSLISSLGGLLVLAFIRTRNLKIRSKLLSAEVDQWVGDTALSVAVLIGFGISYFLNNTGWNFLVPYADPVMLIIVSSFFLIIPVKTMFGSLGEILVVRSKEEEMKPVEEIAKKLAEKLDAEYKLRMITSGREYFVVLNFLTPTAELKVDEIDQVRQELTSLSKNKAWLFIGITRKKEFL